MDRWKEKTQLTDLVFLNYGESKSGTLCITFEYSPSDCSLNYTEINYSDYGMKKYVEGNPYVLKNVDAYLRNKLF